MPANTASTCSRSPWNSARSAGSPSAPERPLNVALPSALDDEVRDHVRPLGARGGGEVETGQKRTDIDATGIGKKLAKLHRAAEPSTGGLS